MQEPAHGYFKVDSQFLTDLFAVRVISLSAYVLLLCELFATIHDEVRYIWPTRWSTVKVIYLYNRYWNLAVLAAANAQILGIWRGDSPEFCFRATLALSLLQFWSFAGVHVLVLLRAWSTWGRRTKVCIVLGAMFVVYASICVAIIIWGVIVGGVNAYPGSDIVGTCVGPVPPLSWLIWVPGLVLETAVFILTMVSLREFNRDLTLNRRSRIVRIITRDGILYFGLCVATSILNMVVWSIYGDRPINMLANSLTNCLIIIAGQRLVLDLRRVSGRGTLTTTRVGREVDRAFAALRGAFRTHAAGEVPRAPRPPSSIRFAHSDLDLSALPSPASARAAPRREASDGTTLRDAGDDDRMYSDEDEDDAAHDGDAEAMELVVLGPGRERGSPMPSSLTTV